MHKCLTRWIVLTTVGIIYVIGSKDIGNAQNDSNYEIFETPLVKRQTFRRHRRGNLSPLGNIKIIKSKKKKVSSKSMSMGEVEFPYSLQQQLDEHLLNIEFSYDTSVSQSIELNCESEISDTILKRFPMSVFHWLFNSKLFYPDESRMEFQGGILEILSTETSDSGVYVCKLEYSPKRFKTVAFFSLVVDSEKTDILLDERKKLKRRCPSVVFGLLYLKAFRVWKLNGETFSRLGKMLARNTSAEVLSPLYVNMTGRWTCVVSDAVTERLWTVASFNLKVISPPPFKQQAEEFVHEYPVLSFIAVLSPTFFIVVCGVLFCYRAKADKKYMKPREQPKVDTEIIDVAIEVSEPSETDLPNQ